MHFIDNYVQTAMGTQIMRAGDNIVSHAYAPCSQIEVREVLRIPGLFNGLQKSGTESHAL